MNCFPDGKLTSIKCHQAPGGNSSFNVAWTSDNSKPRRSHSRRGSISNLNTITGETNQVYADFYENQENTTQSNLNTQANDGFAQPIPKSGKFANTPRGTLNLFGNYDNIQKPNSIKVSNAPGGKSNVLLGDDATSYNEYRTKK